ncbi:hypothetical protein [Endozoicomonas sp. ONNA2]|uniref:hypothetical protein n=1 Tax=Endozoicomonas sp. ONNA2 TaxID=2828741 RepID=UPI00214871A0|nr:hypothetical protein [Endozoicomonas sp. ONNA2]
MNIGKLATGLAVVGLRSAFIANTAAGDLPRWRARAVMTIAGAVGTTLGLVQCFQEGENVSAKTLVTLATNASVFAYSFLQPLADTNLADTNEDVLYETSCTYEIVNSADGTLEQHFCRQIPIRN